MEIAKLRKERAILLGYASHADLVLEERMAKNPDNVMSFLTDLCSKALPYAKTDIEKLKKIAIKDGITDFQKWDIAFYSEKLKKALFEIDDETLKPYFEINKVLEGVFKVSNLLFDLEFEEEIY